MREACVMKHIVTADTFPVTTVSSYIEQIVYCATSVGAGWTFVVQDKGDTFTPVYPIQAIVKVAVSATTTPTEQKVFYDRPIPMRGGIDIVTTGTPGALDIWITGFASEEQS